MVAAMSTASELDLAVDDAVVLNDSNRLVARLLPCDIVARASPTGWFSASREVELARRLAEETDGPIAGLDPRVEPRVCGKTPNARSPTRWRPPAWCPPTALIERRPAAERASPKTRLPWHQTRGRGPIRALDLYASASALGVGLGRLFRDTQSGGMIDERWTTSAPSVVTWSAGGLPEKES
jgi:hypothetical protein